MLRKILILDWVWGIWMIYIQHMIQVIQHCNQYINDIYSTIGHPVTEVPTLYAQYMPVDSGPKLTCDRILPGTNHTQHTPCIWTGMMIDTYTLIHDTFAPIHDTYTFWGGIMSCFCPSRGNHDKGNTSTNHEINDKILTEDFSNLQHKSEVQSKLSYTIPQVTHNQGGVRNLIKNIHSKIFLSCFSTPPPPPPPSMKGKFWFGNPLRTFGVLP